METRFQLYGIDFFFISNFDVVVKIKIDDQP